MRGGGVRRCSVAGSRAGGEQVAAGGVDEARDGVEGDALADLAHAQVASEARAVAGCSGFAAPVAVKALRGDAHALRVIVDEAGEGARAQRAGSCGGGAARGCGHAVRRCWAARARQAYRVERLTPA